MLFHDINMSRNVTVAALFGIFLYNSAPLLATSVTLPIITTVIKIRYLFLISIYLYCYSK